MSTSNGLLPVNVAPVTTVCNGTTAGAVGFFNPAKCTLGNEDNWASASVSIATSIPDRVIMDV